MNQDLARSLPVPASNDVKLSKLLHVPAHGRHHNHNKEGTEEKLWAQEHNMESPTAILKKCFDGR
jgi:hypothetical protein